MGHGSAPAPNGIYKIRANSNRVVKVDIFPAPDRHHDIVVQTHRSRLAVGQDSTMFSTRRPSIVTLVTITLVLVLVELQIVSYMRQHSVESVHLYRTQSHTKLNPGCNFVWATMKCSPGCCLRTHNRKGSSVAFCDLCDSISPESILSIELHAPTSSASSGSEPSRWHHRLSHPVASTASKAARQSHTQAPDASMTSSSSSFSSSTSSSSSSERAQSALATHYLGSLSSLAEGAGIFAEEGDGYAAVSQVSLASQPLAVSAARELAADSSEAPSALDAERDGHANGLTEEASMLSAEEALAHATFERARSRRSHQTYSSRLRASSSRRAASAAAAAAAVAALEDDRV